MPGPVQDPGKIKGPVYIPNCVAIRLIWQLPNGKPASNILHGSYTSTFTPTIAMANSLFTAISTSFTSTGLGILLYYQSYFVGVGLRDLRQDPATGFGMAEFVSNTTPATPGTAANTVTALPPQTSLVVSLKTGFARQANRGRVYIPNWAATADTGAGVASPAAVTAASGFITQLASTVAGTPYNLSLCIAHPQRQSYPSRTPGAPAIPARAPGTVPVISIAARDNIWDTQRLRVRP